MVVNFEDLYLRAQMELEGVLGRKEYLIDPINALEPTGGAENASKRLCEQKDNFFLKNSGIGGFGERTFCGYTVVAADTNGRVTNTPGQRSVEDRQSVRVGTYLPNSSACGDALWETEWQ